MCIVFLAFVARRRREIFAGLHFANTMFIKKIDVSRAQSPKISRPIEVLELKSQIFFWPFGPEVGQTGGLTQGNGLMRSLYRL